MKTTWQRTYKPSKKYPPLTRTLSADVVIVGGGLTGISAAYLLARAGKKVIVLEKGTLESSSTTAYTTGFLTTLIDTAPLDQKKIFGTKRTRDIWRAGEHAIKEIEKIINRESISCDFQRCPLFLYAAAADQWGDLEKNYTYAQKAGLPLKLNKTPLPFEAWGALTIAQQAKFHALKYAAGLRRAAEKYGALFFEESEVLELEDQKTVTAITAKGSVQAAYAIIATYAPFNKPLKLFGRKGLYTSYVYELAIPKNRLPQALYIDGHNPYHYFRVDTEDKKYDRLIIGGEDHRAEIPMKPEKNWQALETFAQKLLGAIDYKIVSQWDSGVLETLDGLPFIGRYSKKFPNRLVATGFSGNGMTYSFIAAKIMTDIINGRRNPYTNLFSPQRGYTPQGLYIKSKQYIGEFAGGAAQNMTK